MATLIRLFVLPIRIGGRLLRALAFPHKINRRLLRRHKGKLLLGAAAVALAVHAANDE